MHADAAAIFLPLVLPVALWVAWSDLARMTIPNRAVLALVAIYAFIGPLVLSLEAWGWGWARLATVLLAGFLASTAGLLGAGDAKFAAAAAPFVPLADAGLAALLVAVLLPAALLVHRVARRAVRVRALVPDWRSWDDPRFPLGVALGPALVLHLALVIAGAGPGAA